MLQRLSPEHLARVCARHPWRVVSIWLVILVISGIFAAGVNDLLETNWSFTSSPESVRGERLLDDRLRDGPEPITETVIVSSETLTVDDAAFRARVEETTAALAGLDGVVASVTNVYQAEALGLPEAAGLVSADRHSTILPLTFAGSEDDADRFTKPYLSTIERMDSDDVRVLPVGYVSVSDQYNHQAEADLIRGELIAVPFAMVILVLVFRSVVAAGIPLMLAGASIVVALGLTSMIARVLELSVFVSNMITMIGLAVGIDYALFIIERYREERRIGADVPEAIAIAGGTASRAVVFSGLTVVLALLGLLFIPTTIFQSLGLGAILAVIAAVVAVLTLVPALLSLLGDRVEWPRRSIQRGHGADQPAHDGLWATVSRVVMRYPVVSIVLSGGLLIALTLPFFDLKRSQTGIEAFPESNVTAGFQILSRDFAAGLGSPLHVVVDAPRSVEVEAGIERFRALAAADPRVAQVSDAQWNAASDVADIVIPLRFGAEEPASYDVVRWLRDDAIPTAFAGTSGEVLVTGISARNTDFLDGTDAWTPLIFGFVLTLSFILLMLMFRSIVVPLKAIVMNLLSVGAAYGLMVLVFQKGYGADLLGFRQMPAIESWIPLFLFCVLFGLSMDYHVFLLSRVQEQFRATGDNAASVAVGIQATGRIITGAALIMVIVFSGFAMGQLVMFQQMGFGLAVAILLDATLVRSVLVPASMALLGDSNWYLPRWLAWLPDLRVEGRPRESRQAMPDVPGAPALADGD